MTNWKRQGRERVQMIFNMLKLTRRGTQMYEGQLRNRRGEGGAPCERSAMSSEEN